MMREVDHLPDELQAVLDGLLRRGLRKRATGGSGDLRVLVSSLDSASTKGAHLRPAYSRETLSDDLIVTVHDRQNREFSGLVVSVTDSRGSVVRTPLGDRGQAVLNRLGPPPWITRVSRVEVGDDSLPALEINRLLPLAAAHSTRDRDYVIRDHDGCVAVTLCEDDEQHLQATLVGQLPSGCVARVRCVAVGRRGEITRTLVSPLLHSAELADSGAGRVRPAESAVGYDLGPLGDATSVQVFPVEVVDIDQVETDEIAATLRYGWRGSARRAWSEWLGENAAPPAIRDLIDPAIT